MWGFGLTLLLMTGKNKCYNQREGKRGHMREDRVPGFLSSLPNWLPPPPHPPTPLWFKGGTHSLAGGGRGKPIRTKGKTLWYSRYRIIPLRCRVKWRGWACTPTLSKLGRKPSSLNVGYHFKGTGSQDGKLFAWRETRHNCIYILSPCDFLSTSHWMQNICLKCMSYT